jgi:hypothetical protein
MENVLARMGFAGRIGLAPDETNYYFYLRMLLVVIYDLVGGQISPKNMVDDGNLTAFIIRYRYR